MMLMITLTMFALITVLHSASAGTSISVSNEYKKEVNVKIGGLGVGGCDVVLQPGEANPTDCWCLWGTLHYTFCAYTKVGAVEKGAPIVNNTTSLATADGRCPLITGESLLCSDLSSLGNCYDRGSYACTVDSGGMCHCATV